MNPVSPARRPATARVQAIDQHALALLVLTAAAGAWVAVAVLHGDGHATVGPALPAESHAGAAHAGHGAHHAPPAGPGGALTVSALAVATAGWALMVVAMMLPPALPLLGTVRRLVSRRRQGLLLTLLAAVTFVGVWTLVGVVLVAGNLQVQALSADARAAGADLAWVPGAVVLAAGVYQFTPAKDWCLRGCRSPRSFVLRHWQGRRSAPVEVATVTTAYAASCVGCCWALMLVCFAAGAAAVPVMVALAVVMAAERLVPWGRRLVRPTGVVLIVLGLAMLAVPTIAGRDLPL